jgi:hypothetical protein
VTLALLAGIVVLVARRTSDSLLLDLVYSFALSAAVLPIVMTHAHENHFFAAAVLGIVPLALAGSRAAWIGYNVTLLAQFANLVGLYGFGRNGVSTWWPFSAWTDLYYDHASVPVALSWVATAGFVLYAVALVRAWPFSGSARAPGAAWATTSIWPASGLHGRRR